MGFLKNLVVGLAGLTLTVAANSSCPSLQVRTEGEAVGQIKNVSGISVYHSYPPNIKNYKKAVLHISDVYGISLLEGRLLADSIAANGYLVIMPDLYNGDVFDPASLTTDPTLTAWRAAHPPESVDPIINTTLSYMRRELGVERIGGVGYCFGGKYVPRWLREDAGVIDVGFIAHPSFLTEEEIAGVAGGLSIAAGSPDPLFNSTAKGRAETILETGNIIFESTLYAQAPHGFAVMGNVSAPTEVYAKQASFMQAVTWFNEWL
ncbi:hypothetical protein J1614_012060 [Plenodomus biglobosus]|nr:hypothetical protein J1614_012060 [Plenodomus biglobosus]